MGERLPHVDHSNYVMGASHLAARLHIYQYLGWTLLVRSLVWESARSLVWESARDGEGAREMGERERERERERSREGERERSREREIDEKGYLRVQRQRHERERERGDIDLS